MKRAKDGILLLARVLVAALFLPSDITKLVNFRGFATSALLLRQRTG